MKRSDRRRLDAWFEGELSIERELELERDAARDPELGDALRRLEALREACLDVATPPVDRLDVAGLAERVRRELGGVTGRGRESARERWSASRRPRSIARLGALAALAAALALAVGLAAWRATDGRRGSRDGGTRADLVAGADVKAADAAGARAPRAGGAAAIGAPAPADTRADVTSEDVARPDIARPDIARSDIARSDVARADSARADSVRLDGARSDVVPLPRIPHDEALHDAAVDAFARVLVSSEVLGELAVARPGGAAELAARASRELARRAGEGWPVEALAMRVLGGSDPAPAAAAARFLGAKPNRLATAKLAERLAASRDAELTLAIATALAEQGEFAALAPYLASAASGDAGARITAAWRAGGAAAWCERLAASLPSDWTPEHAEGLAFLAESGREGADVLARIALGASGRRAAELDAALERALTASAWGGEAVADLARAHERLSAQQLDRLCDWVRRVDALGALPWLQGHARRGEPAALATIASLSGEAPVDALLELEGEGLLRDAETFRRLAERDAARVAAALARLAVSDPAAAELLAARLVEVASPSAVPALAAAAGARTLDPRLRERAAMVIAELGPDAARSDAAALARGLLDALASAASRRGDESIAAAVLLAIHDALGAGELALALDSTPPLGSTSLLGSTPALERARAGDRAREAITRAVTSTGGATARHERTERALESALGGTGRRNRGTETANLR